MCLAVPVQIVQVVSEDLQLAAVDSGGVRRVVNTGLLVGTDLAVGDWLMVHVGVALARIDEEEARQRLAQAAQVAYPPREA